MNNTEREKLLAQRAKLEDQIRDLRTQPVGKSNAAAAGRVEDLTKLAHKIVLIDKKLGRVV